MGNIIRVIKHVHSGSMFYNYTRKFSVVLTAVQTLTTALCTLTVLVYRKDCDSTIFKLSTLRISIQTNMLELPSERPPSVTECPNVPHFFVGDEGFALNRNIRSPCGGSNMSVKKTVYNYRWCRARRYAECGFRIFSNKWRILQWDENET